MKSPPMLKGWIEFVCACGEKWGQTVAHYDVIRCKCGKFFWALQPHRGGPLAMFPWPGLPKPIPQ